MSADSRGEASQEAERKASRRAYERVVETLRQQTGGEQSAVIPETHLRQVCCSSGSLDVDAYRSAIRAATQHGDVVDWHGQLVLAEEETIRAAIAEEVDSEAPRRSWIGRLNTALAELEDGGRP